MCDLIDRQAAIDVFGDIHPLDYNAQAYQERIKQLPSAQPEITDEDLKQYCNKRCLVVITSDLYGEMMKRWSSAQSEQNGCAYWDNESGFCALHRPSAQPERMTGRWIYGAEGTFGNPHGHYCCSVCGRRLAWREKFCPTCGAKMEGSV